MANTGLTLDSSCDVIAHIIYGWGRPRDGGEFESPADPERCLTPPPPLAECYFEGPHSKISAMGPEFLATALRAITVSGPSKNTSPCIIHYNVDENLWPNPQDRVDKNIEVQCSFTKISGSTTLALALTLP